VQVGQREGLPLHGIGVGDVTERRADRDVGVAQRLGQHRKRAGRPENVEGQTLLTRRFENDFLRLRFEPGDEPALLRLVEQQAGAS
jgi:hypothetical protein